MLIFQTQSWWYIFLQPDRIRFRLEKKRRKKKGSLTRFPLGATCLDSWLCSGNWKTPSWSFFSFVCFSSRRGNPSTVTSVSCHHADPGQLSSRWVWKGLASGESLLCKLRGLNSGVCLAASSFRLSKMVSFHLFGVTLVILPFPSLGFNIILLSLSSREKKNVFLKRTDIFLWPRHGWGCREKVRDGGMV